MGALSVYRLDADGWEAVAEAPPVVLPPSNRAPGAIANLVATPGSTSVSLAWDASVDPDGDNVRYSVLRNGSLITPTPIPGRTLVDSGLTSGASFTYTVTPVDSNNATGPTASVSTTTRAPSGFPDETNTGPTAAGYTTLTDWSGSTTISTANTTITARRFPNGVTVTANNVKFIGCEIINGLDLRNNCTGTQVIDSLLRSATSAGEAEWLVWTPGSAELLIQRCELKWCGSDALKLGVGSYKIYDNYIHSNALAQDGMHVDLIETWDGPSSGLEIVGNTIIYPHGASNTTTCIMLSPSPGQYYANVLVEGNLLGGCTYVIYPPGRGTSTSTPASNCRIIDNHVTTQNGLYPDGGAGGVSYHSPNVVMDWNANGNVWSGNVWHDGPRQGQTITPAD